MRSIQAHVAVFTLAVLGAHGAPTDYTPPGGWDSIDYPAGTGENLHEYPAPPGGWESVNYPPGTGENLPSYPPGTGENLPSYPPGTGQNNCPTQPAPATPDWASVFFTSTYKTVATPDQVVNSSNVATGGLAGCEGTYEFGINRDLDLICWNIKLTGFRGEYQSPANTATHIHEAGRGLNGPPRIAFPNPTGDGHERFSRGCAKGPFLTGVIMNGTDTGEGFMVREIEENPSQFFADVHSSLAVPGAVRGQLA